MSRRRSPAGEIGGHLLAVAVGVQHADDRGQVGGVQGLDVVAGYVVQGPGQAEFLVRVLGAVAQPPERVVDFPVGELDEGGRRRR